MPSRSSDRRHDIVLFGATGFTGRLVAEYLARTPEARELSWAIAGRDRGKLEHVRAELAALNPRCADLPLLVADAGDRAALDRVAAAARVVCTTVGPFAKYGSHLVAACAAAGTDYCDITGEVQWVRQMIDAHHETAARTGARIVHTCGFDSIPSDLGTLVVQEHARARFGRPCTRVSAWFGEMKGGFSGGTFASMLHLMDEIRRDRSVLRVVGDPYALDPRPRQGGPDRSDPRRVRFEPTIGRWTGAFVMAATNSRVVRRSHALLGYPWGREFSYQEGASFPRGARGLGMAAGMTAGLAGFVAAAQVPALRKVIEKRLPSPGEGPSAGKRAAGYFVVRLVGEIDGAPKVLGRVADRRDPGYGSTSMMLGQSALCLALDERARGGGGVLTPAAAMGMRLVERLRREGMTLEASDYTGGAVA
jgi:short subunit dehydrogenase-like uncharacterized protein